MHTTFYYNYTVYLVTDIPVDIRKYCSSEIRVYSKRRSDGIDVFGKWKVACVDKTKYSAACDKNENTRQL